MTRSVASVAPSLLLLFACNSDVPLGGWALLSDAGDPAPAPAPQPPPDTPPVTTQPEGDGGASLAPTAPSPFPECGAAGTPGSRNARGAEPGATETATDWSWSAPPKSLQWDLMIERDVPERSSSAIPVGGYYWVHQFSFEQGVAGRLGIQTEGVYQLDASDPPVFTKMAVLWLSGPPMAAELGDIPFPDARIAPTSVAGANWLTLHARFDWQLCHVYRLQFGPESSDEGGTWYGAWIRDLTDATTTFLGRMLLPTDIGLLAPFSSSRSSPFELREITSCAETPPVSAVFGAPTSIDGAGGAVTHTNRFSGSQRCATSRFTEFPNGVRHELGLRDE